MLLYFWIWSVILLPKAQSRQWQIAQCARNHPWWLDGKADHDQVNAKLGFEPNGIAMIFDKSHPSSILHKWQVSCLQMYWDISAQCPYISSMHPFNNRIYPHRGKFMFKSSNEYRINWILNKYDKLKHTQLRGMSSQRRCRSPGKQSHPIKQK